MILGIDTTAGQCAVALVLGDAPSAACAEAMARGHAERLFPMIEAVLAEAGVTYGDLRRIAVCTGPGSFTGIRVGVAAARGLALGLSRPAVGIDRFTALSAGVSGPAAVAIAGPRATAFLRLCRDGAAEGADRQVSLAELEALTDPAVRLGDGWPGAAPAAGLADPATLARLAVDAPAEAPPAPYYLRSPNADPPRHAPPPRIG